MIVGRGLAWCMNRRRGQDQGLPREVEEALIADEKVGLMEDDELPPIYEDVEVIVIEEK